MKMKSVRLVCFLFEMCLTLSKQKCALNNKFNIFNRSIEIKQNNEIDVRKN